MRCFSLLFILLSLAACDSVNRGGEVDSLAESLDVAPSRYEVVASRSYGPDVHEDGFVALQSMTTLVVPERIQVIQGNSGNHGLAVFFDDVTCRYRGGSRLSSPLARKPFDPGEAALGNYYHFVSCRDGRGALLDLQPNEPVFTRSSVKVRIEHGDPSHETQVRAVIQVVI